MWLIKNVGPYITTDNVALGPGAQGKLPQFPPLSVVLIISITYSASICINWVNGNRSTLTFAIAM